jgi:hypothetical protein
MKGTSKMKQPVISTLITEPQPIATLESLINLQKELFEPWFLSLNEEEQSGVFSHNTNEIESQYYDFQEMVKDFGAMVRQPKFSDVTGKIRDQIAEEVEEMMSEIDFTSSEVIEYLYPMLLALRAVGVIETDDSTSNREEDEPPMDDNQIKFGCWCLLVVTHSNQTKQYVKGYFNPCHKPCRCSGKGDYHLTITSPYLGFLSVKKEQVRILKSWT